MANFWPSLRQCLQDGESIIWRELQIETCPVLALRCVFTGGSLHYSIVVDGELSANETCGLFPISSCALVAAAHWLGLDNAFVLWLTQQNEWTIGSEHCSTAAGRRLVGLPSDNMVTHGPFTLDSGMWFPASDASDVRSAVVSS